MIKITSKSVKLVNKYYLILTYTLFKNRPMRHQYHGLNRYH